MESIQHLLSLPPAMASSFGELCGDRTGSWFASCDPPGGKLGSGGGVAQMLADAWQSEVSPAPFDAWLQERRRLVLLAGGQSRRLPAYAACGKVLMPVPIMRWSHGQRLTQSLLDLQADDYRTILESAPGTAQVLVASGDVFLSFPNPLPEIPEADIVGFGMVVPPELASNFGVFFSPREAPGEVAFFLQKPSPDRTRELARENAFFVDTGLWLLGERAVARLMRRCGWSGERFEGGRSGFLELYSGVGPALGHRPENPDDDFSGLSVRIVPLPDAEFYHFGTTRQVIESLSALQNRVRVAGGQPDLWRKPHPDMYVLNSDFAFARRTAEHRNLWIENSALPDDFLPSHENAITGLPPGDWRFSILPGECVDCLPVDETDFVVRHYGFDDSFSGSLGAADWMGRPAGEWFDRRKITFEEAGISPGTDIQETALFAVVETVDSHWIDWLLHGGDDEGMRRKWLEATRISARELGERSNLRRLFSQRRALMSEATGNLWAHRASNPFFRIDLDDVARAYAVSGFPDPAPDESGSNALDSMHEHAFAAAVKRYRGREEAVEAERRAFSVLADRIVAMSHPVTPRTTLIEDQILWARAPVRLDLAGGWSDTPPFCLKHGGAVVNMAVDLNGQAPVQVFVRTCRTRHIVIRSIDLGAESVVRSFEDLADCARVGAEFSLAKAAFCLAGFHPKFNACPAGSLEELLEEFGGGIEVSLLAATPKGSGLGTSSALAATLLAALGSAGGLGWDREEWVRRTLALEQMLTSGGGWQDQAGAVYHGIKLVETGPGLDQRPIVRWLPEHLFGPQTSNRSALLYYTGITRVAKTILQEIVRGMFLNSHERLSRVFAIREHAKAAYQSIQRESWNSVCQVVKKSWELNQALDEGTNPPEIHRIVEGIDDWVAGLKLLGAGGGGYMLILAKDETAGDRVRAELTAHPPNARARFVDFSVSQTGLQITRS